MSIPFVLEQVFDAPINKVWQVMTDADQMRLWYFPALLKFHPIVGFRFEFIDDVSTYQKEWIVTKVIAGRKLSHRWSYKGYPGRSEVTFELFEEGDSTRLRLTHMGIDSFPDDPHFARQRFADGWERIIGINLKALIEHDDK